jgi:hypothetical protein
VQRPTFGGHATDGNADFTSPRGRNTKDLFSPAYMACACRSSFCYILGSSKRTADNRMRGFEIGISARGCKRRPRLSSRSRDR